MLINGKAKRYFQSNSLFAFLLVLELIIAGVIADRFYKSLWASYRQEGQVQFDRAFHLLNGKVENYVNGLHGMGGVYLVRGFKYSNKESREYAQFRNFFSNFPGVLGFGFIRYIKAGNQATYQNEIQNKLGRKFEIKQLSPGPYNDLMVIESIEPLEVNQAALGLDVGSEPKRRKAALLAMRTGRPVLTEPVRLVQTDREDIGFLFYLPLFEGGVVPATPEEREAKLKGWAYAPITSSAIKDYLVHNVDASVRFEIYDKLNSTVQVKIADNASLQSYQFEKVFRVGEREWILRANYERKGFAFYIAISSFSVFLVLCFLFVGISKSVRKLVLFSEKSVKRAQLAEDWFSTIINSSHFCILSTDEFGVINTLNTAAESLIGYNEKEVVGKLSPAFFLGGILNFEVANSGLSACLHSVEELLKKAKLNGLEVLEIEAIKKNGSKFPARLVVTPVFGSDSRLEGFLLILEDLTEVVKMRKEIELKQHQIIAASRLSSLGEMAAGLAHEINNPLSMISSKVNVMLDRSTKGNLDDATMADGLKKIDATVLRIANLVRGLKTFSRDATKDPLLPASIREIVNDSTGLCGDRFKKQGVLLTVVCTTDAEVMCRASQLTQVLVNLMTNALDAVETLSEKWTRIFVESDGTVVRIKVVDSGHGIEADIIGKILDPFFTTKDSGKGTGLGLSISKSIMDEHNGNLFYDSSAHNTTFVVELPLE